MLCGGLADNPALVNGGQTRRMVQAETYTTFTTTTYDLMRPEHRRLWED